MTIVARSPIDRLVGLVRLICSHTTIDGVMRGDGAIRNRLQCWPSGLPRQSHADQEIPPAKFQLICLIHCVGMLMCRKTYQGKKTNQAELRLLRRLQTFDHVIFSLCVIPPSTQPQVLQSKTWQTFAVQNARLGPLNVAMLGLDDQLLHN